VRAEYGAAAEDVDMGDAAEAPAATAAGGAAAMAESCGARPPIKPSDWPTMTLRDNGRAGTSGETGKGATRARRRRGQRWAEMTEDGPGAPLATTHGPSAEVFCEGAECDIDIGNAAEAPAATAAAAAGV